MKKITSMENCVYVCVFCGFYVSVCCVCVFSVCFLWVLCVCMCCVCGFSVGFMCVCVVCVCFLWVLCVCVLCVCVFCGFCVCVCCVCVCMCSCMCAWFSTFSPPNTTSCPCHVFLQVPGLFEGDEFTTLMTQCKEGSQRDGLMLDSAEELYKWFTHQVCPWWR